MRHKCRMFWLWWGRHFRGMSTFMGYNSAGEPFYIQCSDADVLETIVKTLNKGKKR